MLFVLGMHRSGTSMAAAMLSRLGWDVGPEDELMPSKPDNPTGFVEHMPAVRLNGRLLNRRQGTWDAPGAHPPGWEHDPALDDLREEAREVVAALAARADRVLVKDPRFSITLPFWRTVTPLQPLVVLRPPRPVVASLLRRERDMTTAGAARLWTRYTLSAAAAAPDATLVHAPALHDPTGTRLRELSRALGHEPTDEQVAAAVDVLEPRLWGPAADKREVRLDHAVELEDAVRVHDLLDGPGLATWWATLGRTSTVVLDGVDALVDELAEQRARNAELLATADRIREERRNARRRSQEMRDQRDGAAARVKQLQAELDRHRAQAQG